MPAAKPTPRPKPFATAAALRRWFDRNHDTRTELWMLFYKVGSGKKSVSYVEALDEALCFGWIDTTVRSIDETSYMQRWTPRRKGSYWSAVNVAKAQALVAQGRMAPAGLAAFEGRDKAATARYSFEKGPQDLPRQAKAAFQQRKTAWTFWQEQPPGYRRNATGWVVSAKREETRARRLAQLIACSARRERLPHLTSPTAKRAGARGPRAGSRRR